MKDRIEKLESKRLYHDSWLELWVDHFRLDGKERTYSKIKRNDSVVIVPLSKNGNTVILKHFRFPIESYSYELPMGGIEHGETPEVAAERELLEETGLKCTSKKLLGKYYAVPGLSAQKVYVFVADIDDTEMSAAETHDRGAEIAEVHVIQMSEVQQMVVDGEVTDSFTLSALTHVFLHRNFCRVKTC